MMGLWYGSEIIVHSQDFPGTYEYDSCVIIHLTDATDQVSCHRNSKHLDTDFNHMKYYRSVWAKQIAAMAMEIRTTTVTRITMDAPPPLNPPIRIAMSTRWDRFKASRSTYVWFGVSVITIWSILSTIPPVHLVSGPTSAISGDPWSPWTRTPSSRALSRWWKRSTITWCWPSAATMLRAPYTQWFSPAIALVSV